MKDSLSSANSNRVKNVGSAALCTTALCSVDLARVGFVCALTRPYTSF